MASLVHDLQQAALDEDCSVSLLLRKALVVASKLGVSDFESWARSELEGYTDENTPIPKYRHVRGTPMVWNPYHGNQHLNCDTAKMAERISVMHINASVDAIDEGTKKGGNGYWQMSYAPEIEHALMKGMTHPPLKPHLSVSESVIHAILGRVRTIVLDWSLTLEKRGIVGEGMTFSKEEKHQAASVHIGTFIQNVADSQLQLNSPGAVMQMGISEKQLAGIRELIAILDDATVSTPLHSDEVDELRAERDTLLAQSSSPKPKRSVIRASLGSLQRVLEGAGGELLAKHLPRAVELASELLESLG
jgi:AbiTii-like protein